MSDTLWYIVGFGLGILGGIGIGIGICQVLWSL